LGITPVFSYNVILEQKNFNALKGVALPFFCSGKLAFFIEALKFDVSDSGVFAASRQFRECSATIYNEKVRVSQFHG
jgi:hypothetical protein